MKARICLITPSHLSMNPRVVKEADALTEAGYDVAVIAADFSEWGRSADAVFRGRAWRVVASPRFGPLAPAHIRIRELVFRHTARLLVRGLGLYHPLLVRVAFHSIAPYLVSLAKQVTADLYIAHYPAALAAAAIAARFHDAQYAYDAEDFHLGDPPEGIAHETERRIIRVMEGPYLDKCAYVTAASPGIANAYVQAYNIKRPTVILNVFPRVNAPNGPTPWGAYSPSVYWFSQTVGPDRGLECAVIAISRAKSRPHLYLRGTPAKGFIDRLMQLAKECDVSDRVHLLAPAPPDQMEHLAALYDVGFVGETGHTPNRRIALTNKQFTYLLAGVPIVMSDIPAHRAFAKQVGVAARLFPVENPDGLAAAFDSLFHDRAALAEARARAFALGQSQFNWDCEKSLLLEQVTRVVASCRRSSEKSRRA